LETEFNFVLNITVHTVNIAQYSETAYIYL